MFIFAVCQIGAESALKKEIAKDHPNLRFAYSRPGFLTFKELTEKPIPANLELNSTFARAYGVCIGKASAPEEIFSAARALIESMNPAKGKLRLHVWERDSYVVGEEPKTFEPEQISARTFKELQNSSDFAQTFFEEPKAQAGELVFDLIYLDSGSWWMGYHQHTPLHSPFPGGKPPLQQPSEAPSRAYLKLEEALLWSGMPLGKGDHAVEIGSAPGGASYSLLQRGLNVIGIDPGEMAPGIAKFGRDKFCHIPRPAAQVRRTDLPASVQWILLDMNVAPVISLNTVERIAPWFSESLLGLILTLKLNEWKHADEIPKLLRRVEKLGMVRIRTRQLAHNKQEICVVALNRKGVARLRNQA